MYRILFILLILISCSDFDEKYELEYPSSAELSYKDLKSDIPIINIEVDQEEYADMWDNYDDEIEIDCRVSMRRKLISCLDKVEAELEIKGGRSASFDIKSFGLKFEDSQDNSDRKIISPKRVLPFHNINSIKSLRLRNSGNDYKQTMLKDAMYTELAISADLDIDIMYFEPAHVFINNEYYGMLNIRTESNSHGIAKLYSNKKKNITMAKVNTPGEIEIKDGDENRVWSLVEKVDEGDVSYIIENIDIDNFIDYVVFQTFVAHGDWPQNNVRMYAIDEGKFRFVMYDLDYACSFDLDKEPLFFVRDGNGSLVEKMFELVYSDEEFKQQFEDRYQMIIDNRILESSRFVDIVNAHTFSIEEEMVFHIQKNEQPKSLIEWYRNVEEMIEFYKIREKNVNEFYGIDR